MNKEAGAEAREAGGQYSPQSTKGLLGVSKLLCGYSRDLQRMDWGSGRNAKLEDELQDNYLSVQVSNKVGLD